jgi:hypothetical protein
VLFSLLAKGGRERQTVLLASDSTYRVASRLSLMDRVISLPLDKSKAVTSKFSEENVGVKLGL